MNAYKMHLITDVIETPFCFVSRRDTSKRYTILQNYNYVTSKN